ncbi:MAG: NAD(P)H-hydrate dehydratase, partial [Gemmatimonadota bacterium]
DVVALLERLCALDVPIVAIDAPTGLDLGSGANMGAHPVDRTVTFGGVRRGHLRARDLVGDLHVVEIGLPAADPEWPVVFDLADARAAYRPFVVDDHKGTRGRVVIVGGREGMTGAARLVARAAFASGAGLVHVATDTASAIILAAAEPDVQVLCTRWDGAPDESLLELVRSADVVIVGPGLGREPGVRALVEGVIAHAGRLVLDADGLQAFAGDATALATMLVGIPTILTPHPGEFRALFPDIPLDDPWEAAHAAAMRMGQVVLLKGVPTVIASRGSTTLTVARGNPGLATGGSGDVLSGIIGALWCRHDEAREAAALGAVAHGDAADRVARLGGVVGMRPMDVVERLAAVWHELAQPDTEFRDLLLYLPRPVTQ